MKKQMPNCWELMECGREKGGHNEECIASRSSMGHSCWAIAGTLCGDKIQGTTAQKIESCTKCEVYKKYNRFIGENRQEVALEHPEEHAKYLEIIKRKQG